jgi:hypothetical protein
MDNFQEVTQSLEQARTGPSRLFHLTPLRNIRSIRARGLNAGRKGNIFAYSHPLVANRIAATQVFCLAYGVFEIDWWHLDEPDIIPDRVAELSAPWQWIIKRKHIEPGFLTFAGRFKVHVSRPDPFDHWFMVHHCGMTEEQYQLRHQTQRKARSGRRTSRRNKS